MDFRRISTSSAVVLIFYGVGLLVLGYFHVLGQDEAQAWNIAKASRYPWDVLLHGEFEGHTPLWHLMLWGISFLSVEAVSYFTAALSMVFAFLLLRDRPFPLWVCVIFLFGYFTFYDYPSIPRPYVVALVGASLYASALYHRRYDLIYLSCILSVVAFSSSYGILLSAPLGILALTAMWQDGHRLTITHDLIVGLVIYFTALAMSAYLIVFPLDGNEFAQKVLAGERSDSLLLTKAALSSAFPHFRQLPFGVGVWLGKTQTGWVLMHLAVGIVVVSATALLVQRRAGVLAWLVALVVIPVGASFAGTGTIRHLGHLYIAAFSIFWVASRDSKNGLGWYKHRSFAIPSMVVVGVLLYQFALGVGGVLFSIKSPQTSGKEIAAYIEKQIEPPYRFITNNTHDFGHVMAYLDIPVYDTVCDCWQRRADMSKSRAWEPAVLYQQWCRLYKAEGVRHALIATDDSLAEDKRYEVIKRFSRGVRDNAAGPFHVLRMTNEGINRCQN